MRPQSPRPGFSPESEEGVLELNGIINVSIELTCLAFSLTFLSMLLIVKDSRTEFDKAFVAILAVNVAIYLLDPITWLFDGASGPYVRPLLYAVNSAVYVLGYACVYLFTLYIVRYLSLRSAAVLKRYSTALAVYFTVMTALTLTSPVTGLIFSVDGQNRIQLGPLDVLVYCCTVGFAMANIVLIVKNRARLERRSALILALCSAITSLFTVIELFTMGVMLSYVALDVGLVVLYMSLHLRRDIELVKRENATRTSLMLSQIQPHFLINSLLAIKALTRSDPKEACKAIDDFSYYLRGNMHALTSEEPVPFEDELEHMRAYLALEKRRFGEKVRVVEDIRSTAVRLPALTLQPLVENAVQHGIAKREDGGTVVVSAREEAESLIIAVQDDGVGFDVETVMRGEDRAGETLWAPDGDHVGLRNVAARIASQCKGTLVVESDPNGTCVTVTIPKQHG